MVTTWHTGLIFPYYFISFTYPCPSKPNWTSWKIMARVGGCYFLLQSFPVFWKKIPITKFRGDKMGIFSWCSSRVWKKKAGTPAYDQDKTSTLKNRGQAYPAVFPWVKKGTMMAGLLGMKASTYLCPESHCYTSNWARSVCIAGTHQLTGPFVILLSGLSHFPYPMSFSFLVYPHFRVAHSPVICCKRMQEK